MLISTNMQTFIAVIYSYKTSFLFNFTAQICIEKHPNSLAKPPPQTPPHPPRRLRRLYTRRLWRLEFLLPHFQNRSAALAKGARPVAGDQAPGRGPGPWPSLAAALLRPFPFRYIHCPVPTFHSTPFHLLPKPDVVF